MYENKIFAETPARDPPVHHKSPFGTFMKQSY